MLQNAISEFAYPKFKNEILGLCVSDMVMEMYRDNKNVDYFKSNYKNYIPKVIVKHHPFFGKRLIVSNLMNSVNKGES